MEESLKVHVVRKKTEYEYNGVLFACELVNYGFNECIHIQDIISKHKGIYALKLKLVLQQMINKVKKINLIP